MNGSGGKGKEAGDRQGKRRRETPPRGRARPAEGAGGGAGSTKEQRQGRRYTYPQNYEFKRKAVRLYMEEGIPAELVAAELGISKGTVFDWVRQYREEGEAGLQPKGHHHHRTAHYLPRNFGSRSRMNSLSLFGMRSSGYRMRREKQPTDTQ